MAIVKAELLVANPSSSLLSSWTGSSPCGVWSGVSCNGANDITSLSLSLKSLQGSLPEGISYLTALTSLDFTSNTFNGTLPSAWSRLGSLTAISMPSNQLTGLLPTSWQAMASLRYGLLLGLVVSGNSLMCGTIPTALAGKVSYSSTNIGSTCPSPPPAPPTVASALLSIRDTAVEATWPGGFTGWTVATEPCTGSWSGVTCDGSNVSVLAVDLGYWDIETSLQPEMQLLTALTSLSMGGNRLNSTLPAELSAMTSLVLLDLSFNGITGSLPAAWSTLTALITINLNTNKITSTIPQEWSLLTNLNQLLQSNSLTSTLPSEWGPALSLLQQANLASNQLYDTIPASWAAGMTVMSTLALSNNVGMCGMPLPGSWVLNSPVIGTGTGLGSACPEPPSPPPPDHRTRAPPFFPPRLLVCGVSIYLRSSVASWPTGLTGWDVSTSPCGDPIWSRLSCSGGLPVAVDFSFIGLAGSLREWGQVTSYQHHQVTTNA
eukprot:gene50-12865_t